MFRPSNANRIGKGLIVLAKFVIELKTHFLKHTDVLMKLLQPSTKVSKTNQGYPLCLNASNAMYCSSSIVCEEELSIFERGVLVLLGIPSFNAIQEVNVMDRFQLLGEECIVDCLHGCLMMVTIARNELVGCAKVLRSYRHRVVLPPLRSATIGGIGGFGGGGSSSTSLRIDLQLLNQLNYLINTVMLDAPSSCIKVIVQKNKVKL